jgi:CheY-like chemotaxis protein
MQGEIAVESDPGAGSTFAVQVALGVAPAEPAAPRLPAGKEALVVDDSAASRDAIADALRLEGMTVETAADAAVAIARLRARRPDVVLVDHDLPLVDGLALTAAMRAEPGRGGVPVVLLTTRAQRGKVDAAVTGLATVLAKPARRAALVEALAPLIAGTAAVAASTEVPAAPRARAGARLLLAEDNPVNQMVVQRLFARLGYTIDVVPNGREAVRAALGVDYDLVLMDCQMPELDGIDATREIRAAESGRRTPIVALTANATVEDRDRCLEAGMDDFVAKPFKPEQLVALVEEWLARKRPAAAAPPPPA